MHGSIDSLPCQTERFNGVLPDGKKLPIGAKDPSGTMTSTMTDG